MIKIPKDVHKALAVLFKHKLINQTELQQLMEKCMRREVHVLYNYLNQEKQL